MSLRPHLYAAALIAPALALAAYCGVDAMLGEQAAPARAGASYPLLVKSSCRYASGRCELENGDLSLSLSLQPGAKTTQLSVTSSLPLQGIRAAIGGEAASTPLSAAGSEARNWEHRFPVPLRDDDTLRLVVAAGDSLYFAETPVVFAQRRLPWEDDPRRESAP